MITCEITAKIAQLERSYAYHLEQACMHDEMIDYIDTELRTYRTMKAQMTQAASE